MDIFKVFGILILAPLVFGHVLWFVERRKNPDCFPASYPAGVIEATWWSISTLITSGCENISPASILGRLFAIAWMLTSLALVSLVTATLAAKLTVDKLSAEVKGLGDLQGSITGTVTGSTAAAFLQSRNLEFKGYDSIEAACAGLLKGETKAVLYDAPILRYYLSTNPGGQLKLVGDRFDRHNYAFGLQAASPLRKQINQALLELREKGFFDELQRKWFASKEEIE
jgi:ABC-type amino acid transport substrate-binding protein